MLMEWEVTDLRPDQYEVLPPGPLRPPQPLRRLRPQGIGRRLVVGVVRLLLAAGRAILAGAGWLLRWFWICWLLFCLKEWSIDRGTKEYEVVLIETMRFILLTLPRYLHGK